MKRRHHWRKFRLKHRTALDYPSEIPLSDLRAGEKGIVIRVNGGRGMLERVTYLGFVPGTEIYILQNLRHGPIIVRVHDARIALGREIARRIQICRKEA
jgi:ferrous iron transport protein A